ncbi:MAG: MoaD/ThiS family protein [Candidatus Uhrbacteria bacterium]
MSTETKKYTLYEIRNMGGVQRVQLAEQFGVQNARAMAKDALVDALVNQLRAREQFDDAGSPAAPATSMSTPAVDRNVSVSYNTHNGEYAFGGKRLNAVIEDLKGPFGMDPSNLRAYVNGSPVESSSWAVHEVRAGDRVEFIRPSGEKGIR